MGTNPMTPTFIKLGNLNIEQHAEERLWEDTQGECHIKMEYCDDSASQAMPKAIRSWQRGIKQFLP